jgi:hypothetical protein
MPIPLDLTALKTVIERLEQALVRHLFSPLDLQLQDGLILRLKAAYELSYEMLVRYLKKVSTNPGQNRLMTFDSVISHAQEQGLVLGCTQKWHHYREMYLNAKKAYEDAAAKHALRVIPKFLNEAYALHHELSLRTEN